MSLHVPEERYNEIAWDIASDASPVGIDAKKTHIVILHLLEEIPQRLDRIEETLGIRPKEDG